ncbi:MAG: hypothetical protein ACYTER_09680 [Planctomycetota bacterium]|jgi:hypothetical protein
MSCSNDVFTVCDDPKEAARIIKDFHSSNGRSGIAQPWGIKKPNPNEIV